MTRWREGDYFRHIAYPDLLGEVVRVEDWGGGSPVLVGRDATGEFSPGQTFKVPADQVRKVTP